MTPNSADKAYQAGREDMRKEVDNNIGQLRQWLNELPKGHFVTSWEITQWLFPEDKESVINDKDKKPKITQCSACLCMTKTVKGRCGKCREIKISYQSSDCIMYHDKVSHLVGEYCPICHPDPLTDAFEKLMDMLGVYIKDVTSKRV
jgi:hypothetical protein